MGKLCSLVDHTNNLDAAGFFVIATLTPKKDGDSFELVESEPVSNERLTNQAASGMTELAQAIEANEPDCLGYELMQNKEAGKIIVVERYVWS
jgi:hypothetical protein